MDWGFLLGLGAITLLVIGLVIYFGLRISRTVQRQAPESDLALSITPTGSALAAFVVGYWIVCLAARVLAPESWLGAFVGHADGVIAVIVVSVFFFTIAAAILQKLGYPIAKSGGRGA